MVVFFKDSFIFFEDDQHIYIYGPHCSRHAKRYLAPLQGQFNHRKIARFFACASRGFYFTRAPAMKFASNHCKIAAMDTGCSPLRENQKKNFLWTNKKKKKSLKTKNAEEPYKTKPVLGFFQFKLKMKKPSKKSGSSDPQSTIGIKEKINLSLKQWSTIDFYHGGKTTRRPRWTRIVCFEIFFTFKNIFLFQQSFIKFEFN